MHAMQVSCYICMSLSCGPNNILILANCCMLLSDLRILGAVYGRADVTNLLNSRVTNTQALLNEAASNHNFGDSWRGVVKSLVVVYQQEGYDPHVRIVREHH